MRILLIALLMPLTSFGQGNFRLSDDTKVYLAYSFAGGDNHVNQYDAVDMLKSEISEKTTLSVVDSEEKSDYIIEVSVLKKFGDVRRGKLTITNTESKEQILQTKWRRGTASFYNGMSGTRDVIRKLVKDIYTAHLSVLNSK